MGADGPALLGDAAVELGHELRHLGAEARVVERRDLRVGQPCHQDADEARGRLVLAVALVAEAAHPVVGVVHRVVHAAGPAEPHAARRDADVMIEALEVRPAAQVAEPAVSLGALHPGVEHVARARRIGHHVRGVANEMLERR